MGQTFYNPDAPENISSLEDYESLDATTEPLVAPESEELPEVSAEEAIQNIEADDSSNIATEPIEVSQEQYPAFPSSFQAIRWAKQNNETIRIHYKTEKGNILIRDVEPHGSFFAKSTNRSIAVTFDSNVGDVRSYIINNIQNWQFVGKKFTPKFNFTHERRNFLRRMRRRVERKR